MVYQVQESGEWSEFEEIIRPLFDLVSIEVPFKPESDLWIRANYEENDCRLDFVSAGSGFLQVVNLLTFLFRSPTQLALLDEPDSHMHEDLLRLAFSILDKLSSRRNLQLMIATHSPVLIDAAGLDNVLLIDRRESAPKKAKDVDSLIPMLTDRGLSLPPSKVMDTLRTRRVLFVEGEEKDYEQFMLAFGTILYPQFSFQTRGLGVFEIGEGRKDWPFDAIKAFERLIGGGLSYVYLSDRDFLMPTEVSRREARASKEGQRIHHLDRRNRECYLLEPHVLSRLLIKKWSAKHSSEPIPSEIQPESIKAWLINHARDDELETRTALLVQNEAYARGDASVKTEKTKEINAYFQEQFVDVLARGEVPLRLIDGKKTTKGFRAHVATEVKLHFTDIEVIQEFTPSEVSSDIREVVRALLAMFPPLKTGLTEAKQSSGVSRREPPTLF